MSYQVDDSKLITIGNLRNFYDRLWDEMDEEHNSIVNMFAPGGPAVTTNADIDEACFNITSVAYQEQCPDDNDGIHNWEQDADTGNYVCSNCGCELVDNGAHPDNICPKGEHNWISVGDAISGEGAHWLCTICGESMDSPSNPEKMGY